MSERKERLAVALADLDRVDPSIRGKLLAGRLDLTSTVRVGQDRMEDVPAVVFICPLLEAAIICDVLRSHDRKAGDPPTGIYINKAASWSRVTNNTVLTVLVDGKARLNPVIFSDAVALGSAPKVVKLGRK